MVGFGINCSTGAVLSKCCLLVYMYEERESGNPFASDLNSARSGCTIGSFSSKKDRSPH